MSKNEHIEELNRILEDYERKSLEHEFGDAKLELFIAKEGVKFKLSSPEKFIYYKKALKDTAINYGYDDCTNHEDVYFISDKEAGKSGYVIAETVGSEDDRQGVIEFSMRFDDKNKDLLDKVELLTEAYATTLRSAVHELLANKHHAEQIDSYIKDLSYDDFVLKLEPFNPHAFSREMYQNIAQQKPTFGCIN